LVVLITNLQLDELRAIPRVPVAPPCARAQARATDAIEGPRSRAVVRRSPTGRRRAGGSAWRL